MTGAIALLTVLAGCASTGARPATTITPTDAAGTATATTATSEPSTGPQGDGQAGDGMDDYIDPDAESEPVPIPPTEAGGLPDLASYGLSTQDEEGAWATATDFVNAIWTWDATDTTDRAGLSRALELATAHLQGQLRPLLEQPLYSAQDWEELAATGMVGSASQVLIVGPATAGSFDADTYTAQVIYRVFTIGEDGYLLPRPEDARYATVQLTRTNDQGWLVAELPYLQVEQIIEAGAA